MKFSDLQMFVEPYLTACGYEGYTRPSIHPGPTSSPDLLNETPNAMIFLTLGGGAGTTVEQLYDRPFIVVRVTGAQGDYEGAEELAAQLDRLMLAVGSPALIGTVRVLYIARAGPGPLLLSYDDADRYSFQCTYITETTSGVPPMGFVQGSWSMGDGPPVNQQTHFYLDLLTGNIYART